VERTHLEPTRFQLVSLSSFAFVTQLERETPIFVSQPSELSAFGSERFAAAAAAKHTFGIGLVKERAGAEGRIGIRSAKEQKVENAPALRDDGISVVLAVASYRNEVVVPRRDRAGAL
jgi:hypothetical protein